MENNKEKYMGLFDFLHKPSEKNLEGEIKKSTTDAKNFNS